MSGTSPWDAQNLASKISKYRKDFRLFASEQLKLSGQAFNFWPCQEALLQSVESQIREQGFARCCWLKARQVGASSLSQAIVAWRTMLWPNVNAIVIADEQERARNLFEISRYFYDHLDDDIRPVGRYITKRELVFANPSSITRSADPGLRSRIVIESAHKKNIAIGSAWQIAHLSECARFRDPSVVLDGIIPAVHRVPGTVLILESSAEQAGTWYRDFCEQSERGANAFAFVFVPWYQQPEYQIKLKPGEKLDLLPEERHIMAEFGLTFAHIKWMREKMGEMANDWDLFRQNYPLTAADAWITPGVQVFPPNVLRELKEQIRPPLRRAEVFPGPRIMDAPNGRLSIWEDPKPDRAYDMGVDVAMGSGEDGSTEDEPLDNSCVVILERGTNLQVAEWVSKAVDPFEFATTLFWLGSYYNMAQIAVETNAIGGGTNQQLAKMGYVNQYIWRYRDEVVPRYSRKTGWECVVPSSRILTADLRWVPAADIHIGDWIVGCQENPPRGRGLSSHFRMQRVVDRKEFEAPVVEVILSNGQTTCVSTTHPFWVHRVGSGWQWVVAKEVVPGDVVKCLPVWDTLRTYEAGRMSGLLDGEGHLSQNSGSRASMHLLVTQAEGPLAQEIVELWAELGFDWTFKWLRHKDRPREKDVAVSGVVRLADVLRALGSLRPTRLLRKFQDGINLERLTLKGVPNATVVSVHPQGHETVVGLTTAPDHTLIADGIVGHNTNPKSKPWLVGFAIHESVNKRVQIRSELLYKEMTAFIQKGPREWGAVAGYHDDRVMAWMIALLTSDDENFVRYYGLQKTGQQMKQAQADASKPGPWEADLTFNRGNIVVSRESDMKPWE